MATLKEVVNPGCAPIPKQPFSGAMFVSTDSSRRYSQPSVECRSVKA